MRIAITGHRPKKLWNDYDLITPQIKAIKEDLKTIIEHYKPSTLISGMALGIDTLWAKLAIEYNIVFIAAIPCKNQECKWPEISRNRYKNLIYHDLCRRYYVSNLPYTDHCMQDRNIWMVDNCDLLVAIWDGTSGGTANCVKYAQSIDKKIIQLNPKEYAI